MHLMRAGQEPTRKLDVRRGGQQVLQRLWGQGKRSKAGSLCFRSVTRGTQHRTTGGPRHLCSKHCHATMGIHAVLEAMPTCGCTFSPPVSTIMSPSRPLIRVGNKKQDV